MPPKTGKYVELSPAAVLMPSIVVRTWLKSTIGWFSR